MALIRLIAINTALVIGSVVGVLVLIDFFCWLSPLRYQILPPQPPQGYMRFDAELGYDIAPSRPVETLTFQDSSFDVWSNSMGCFDSEYDGTVPYIYVTGDSFAWGWAPFEDKWGKQIEKGLGIRVLTCGVNGYGTRQEAIKASRQLAQLPHPSVILVSYLGANDIDDDLMFPNHTEYRGYSVQSSVVCSEATCTVPAVPLSLHKDIKIWLGTHSVLYTLLQRSVYAPALAYIRRTETKPESANPRLELPKVHTDAMLQLKALAKEKKANLVVVLIPSKRDIRGTEAYSNAYMKAFLEEQHVSFVDLLPVFKTNESLPLSPLYWEHDGHWNIEGNRLAGKVLVEYLKQNIGK